MRNDDDRLLTFEWIAARGLQYRGVTKDTLKPGDRVVAAGNPHHDIAENGIVNLTSVRRPADGWSWAR